MANHVLKNEMTLLHGLFKKLDELKHLNDLFAKHADPELANHCQVVKFEKNCLFILTENGSWATQLRFQIPHLMTQLRQHSLLANIAGIICKTRPALHIKKKSKPSRMAAKLTTQTAEQILQSAKTVTDQKIRTVLEKIASRIKS